MRKALIAALMLAVSATTFAAAPNSEASGRYHDDSIDITFSHVVVLRRDDAERVRNGGPGLRVLLSDVPVPVAALEGDDSPQVDRLVEEGTVHGLLFDVDPANQEEVEFSVLDYAGNHGAPNIVSLGDDAGLWKTLSVADGQLTAELKARPDLTIRFSTPIIEPR